MVCLIFFNILSLFFLFFYSVQELFQEIKVFLIGVDFILGYQFLVREYVRCGFFLFRFLLFVRVVVFDYLRGVFDESVRVYLVVLDESFVVGLFYFRLFLFFYVFVGGFGLEDVVQEVQQVLFEFIWVNLKVWVFVISVWFIDFMG